MISSLVFLAFFLLGSQPAFARYPDPGKIITIICPVSAGGSTGTQLRALAPELEKHLGGAGTRVEHIVGAAGKICYEKGYKSKPDGYTIMNYNLPAPIVTELADKTTRYKTSDFVPIYAVSTSPNVLVVHAETWKTLDEFLREAQKREVTIGTMGNKSANYMQAVAFAEAANIKAKMVPFKGGRKSVQALAGKHVDAVFTLTLSAFGLVRAGKIRPLMVFTDGPDSTYPGAPLSKDSKRKIPAFPLVSTFVGPPGLSADKVKVLEGAFSKAIKEPGFVSFAQKVHLNLTPMNSAKVKAITTRGYQNTSKYEHYFGK